MRFGTYELLDRVAATDAAETFRAHGLGARAGEVVALRRCLRAPDGPRLAAARQLRHPNVARLIDCGQIEGQWYCATEWVDGCDLGGLLVRLGERRERLPLDAALHVTLEVLRALQYAHVARIDGERGGLVHRHVTARNVLLSCAGAVKLTDFGVDPGAGPHAGPRGPTTDHRVDLHAVGELLAEMCRPAPAPAVAVIAAALLAAAPGSGYASASEAMRDLRVHLVLSGAQPGPDALAAVVPAPGAA
jgi:hypothetical protein